MCAPIQESTPAVWKAERPWGLGVERVHSRAPGREEALQEWGERAEAVARFLQDGMPAHAGAPTAQSPAGDWCACICMAPQSAASPSPVILRPCGESLPGRLASGRWAVSALQWPVRKARSSWVPKGLIFHVPCKGQAQKAAFFLLRGLGDRPGGSVTEQPPRSCAPRVRPAAAQGRERIMYAGSWSREAPAQPPLALLLLQASVSLIWVSCSPSALWLVHSLNGLFTLPQARPKELRPHTGWGQVRTESRDQCPALPPGSIVSAGSPGEGAFEMGFAVGIGVHKAGGMLWAVWKLERCCCWGPVAEA